MLDDSKQVFLNQISETKELGLYKNDRIIRSMQNASIKVNGNKVINLLKESSQYTPVAMVRNESQQKEFENQGVTTVWGDLTEDVSNTTKGIDRVIFAAGSGGKNVFEVDQEGAEYQQLMRFLAQLEGQREYTAYQQYLRNTAEVERN